MIARHLASSAKFRGYSFVADMISEAVARCVTAALPKLDPDKNPFSYLTQTCWMSFLATIYREQKYWTAKRRYYEKLTGLPCDWKDGHDPDAEEEDKDK